MEQQIRDLCMELLRTRDPEKMEAIGQQLRSAIHEHVESLRGEVNTLRVMDAAAA